MDLGVVRRGCGFPDGLLHFGLVEFGTALPRAGKRLTAKVNAISTILYLSKALYCEMCSPSLCRGGVPCDWDANPDAGGLPRSLEPPTSRRREICVPRQASCFLAPVATPQGLWAAHPQGRSASPSLARYSTVVPASPTLVRMTDDEESGPSVLGGVRDSTSPAPVAAAAAPATTPPPFKRPMGSAPGGQGGESTVPQCFYSRLAVKIGPPLSLSLCDGRVKKWFRMCLDRSPGPGRPRPTWGGPPGSGPRGGSSGPRGMQRGREPEEDPDKPLMNDLIVRSV
jgi:hypothetical protein